MLRTHFLELDEVVICNWFWHKLIIDVTLLSTIDKFLSQQLCKKSCVYKFIDWKICNSSMDICNLLSKHD